MPTTPSPPPILWIDIVVVALSLWGLWAAWLLIVYLACLPPALWAWLRDEPPPGWVEPLTEWAERIEWGPSDLLADLLLWLWTSARAWIAWADSTLPPTPPTPAEMEGGDDE
jgi:hypothetical protein